MENLTYIEITMSAYYALMRDAMQSGPVEIIESEYCRRVFYNNHEMVLLVLNVFLSPVYQYYLADINS